MFIPEVEYCGDVRWTPATAMTERDVRREFVAIQQASQRASDRAYAEGDDSLILLSGLLTAISAICALAIAGIDQGEVTAPPLSIVWRKES